jgi:hypothetical protein
MIEEIKSLIKQYIRWLEDKTTIRQIDDWIEITTPFLDRHNDYLQIYARKDNNNYVLTDDSYVIVDLHNSGCTIDGGKRKELLDIVLNGFGVLREEDKLITIATESNFAEKKHSLIQAMLAVDDLFYTAKPLVASIFLEDIIGWFDLNEIRYFSNFNLIGKSGYNHHFNFVIPKSATQPDRLIRAINKPNRDKAEAYIFSWLDTKEARKDDAKAIAILNDTESGVPETVKSALTRYDITPLVWSERQEHLGALLQ